MLAVLQADQIGARRNGIGNDLTVTVINEYHAACFGSDQFNSFDVTGRHLVG